MHPTLRGSREAEYRLFLIKEARIGADVTDPRELDRITSREVDAGRMAADSDFRTFAREAGLVLGNTKPRAPGWLGRLFK
jgi:hypothetical protein